MTTRARNVNAIRTRTLIEKADVVVVRFGDKYKQWNAAFDAGYAVGTGQVVDHACIRAEHASMR
jgi:YtoQ family protein